MSNPMADPEVEAAWRAEFKRIGETLPGDAPNAVGGSTNEPKQATFRWLGDETQTRRLREEKTHHYVQWTLFAAVAVAIVCVIGLGLTLLR